MLSGTMMKASGSVHGRKMFDTPPAKESGHPYGQLSTRCRKDGYSDFEGIVECTANQVAEFIEYIEKNGWMDKVAVMVQGDHLAMGNTAYDKLVTNPHRRSEER